MKEKIKLIDKRRYFNLNQEKLKPEDRRFLLMINHDKTLFNENMLLQNRILIIALFALFFSGLSIILSLGIISNGSKIGFIFILFIFSIILVVMYFNANKRVKTQNNFIKTNYDQIFKSHLKYAKK